MSTKLVYFQKGYPMTLIDALYAVCEAYISLATDAMMTDDPLAYQYAQVAKYFAWVLEDYYHSIGK